LTSKRERLLIDPACLSFWPVQNGSTSLGKAMQQISISINN